METRTEQLDVFGEGQQSGRCKMQSKLRKMADRMKHVEVERVELIDERLRDAPKPKTTSMTLRVQMDIMDRVRDVVYWCSGPPAAMNLQRFTRIGLIMACEYMEGKYHGGVPFDRRPGELKKGRPFIVDSEIYGR